ncbi:hypothetical protein Moror_8169 [Moniliophthora roreri MCA 2997]|uniref:Uncharacterized protein n=1 Tax=Moniliophthora roreri (strain MCA 2997) TaxID=1381753 RepID=V2YRR6_MONRO|nr:hypothetical protein Moror_8169 [Moniliophthora roreri MCA 2997]KAI3606373.1 hypothetical protein WG66_009559 [Moniliophthora roreri]
MAAYEYGAYQERELTFSSSLHDSPLSPNRLQSSSPVPHLPCNSSTATPVNLSASQWPSTPISPTCTPPSNQQFVAPSPIIHKPSISLNFEERSKEITTKHDRFLSIYLSLSWMAGFRERYSLLLCLIFGDCLIGFCLARSPLMDPVKMKTWTTPGEFRWFELLVYKVNYGCHIYFSIVGGLLVGLQFLPSIRRKHIRLHRLNGYLVIALLVPANIAGGVIARRAFGGEISTQAAYYVLTVMIVFALLCGGYYAKVNTKLHRKWMLRAIVYFSVPITGRIIMNIAMAIISNMGDFYSLWRCDEILFVLKDLKTLTERYPQCLPSGDVPRTLVTPGRYVPVLASIHQGALEDASAKRVTHGMTLFLAALIHVAAIEFYLQMTDKANFQRCGFALEPQDFELERDTPRMSLNSRFIHSA